MLGVSYKKGEIPPDGVPPPCRTFRMKDTEDSLSVAGRARDSLPGIHGTFTLYNSLKASWRRRCKARYVNVVYHSYIEFNFGHHLFNSYRKLNLSHLNLIDLRLYAPYNSFFIFVSSLAILLKSYLIISLYF